MKHVWLLWIIFALALRLAGMVPFESRDVSRLVPVEALTVDRQGGQVYLRGEDCQGVGSTFSAALLDLLDSGSGEVFLSTAEYIVLSPAAAELLPALLESEHLRPAAQVCVARGGLPEPAEAADYLAAHEGGVTIMSLRAAMLGRETVRLPVLEETEGGLRLHGTNR